MKIKRKKKAVKPTLVRKKTNKEDERLPLWEKISGGFLRLRKGKPKIKPGEKIRLSYDEVAPVRNQFKLLKDVPGAKEEFEKNQAAKVEQAEKGNVSYEPRHKGAGWYEVVSSTGVVMSEKNLRANEARQLADDLNKGL